MTGPAPQDLTGRSFGHLTVQYEADASGWQRLWVVRCDCGRKCTMYQHRLLSGRATQCSYCAEQAKAVVHARAVQEMRRHRWTVRQIADAAGVDLRTVHRWGSRDGLAIDPPARSWPGLAIKLPTKPAWTVPLPVLAAWASTTLALQPNVRDRLLAALAPYLTEPPPTPLETAQ